LLPYSILILLLAVMCLPQNDLSMRKGIWTEHGTTSRGPHHPTIFLLTSPRYVSGLMMWAVACDAHAPCRTWTWLYSCIRQPHEPRFGRNRRYFDTLSGLGGNGGFKYHGTAMTSNSKRCPCSLTRARLHCHSNAAYTRMWWEMSRGPNWRTQGRERNGKVCYTYSPTPIAAPCK
jgi:hypothetical protein